MKSRDDIIVFPLSAEETVVNDTVKITASISAIIAPDMTEENLRGILQAMMAKFIPNTKWIFADINRRAHSSGSEEISLTASTRMPESENRSLEQRRRDASMPEQSINIYRVDTDISFPASLVEETEERLRIAIVSKARAQCVKLSEAMGHRNYRIKKIDFLPDANQALAILQGGSNYRAASASKVSYGSTMLMEDASGASGMGNAQKLTLGATITLASFPA
jgi:hypothetical protein